MVETFVQNSNFVGRKDVLAQLDEALLPPKVSFVSSESQRVRYAAVCGMGGLGKTEIAVEFAFSRKNSFDGAFLVRADGQEKLDSDFAKISIALGLEEPAEAKSQVISCDLAKGWFSNPIKFLNKIYDSVGISEAQWLLIIDNADGPDVLADYAHFFSGRSVLITSRYPLARETISTDELIINPQPFEDNEAQSLLEMFTRDPRQSDKALLIGQKLGGLPLAIAQMGDIIRRQLLTYADFLDVLEDENEIAELHETELGPRQQTARGNVATIWAIEKLSQGSRSLLELLAFLDPDNISEQILQSGLTADKVKLSSGFPVTRLAKNSARAELLQSSLIRRNEEKGEICIHRLLQATVRAKMSSERKFNMFVTALSLKRLAWPDVSLMKRHNTERWDMCQTVYPHILSLQEHYIKNAFDGDALVNVELATLLNEAGWPVTCSWKIYLDRSRR